MTHSLTFPILRRLSDGRFHSGQALAKHFKVTRSTIWNALQEAETLGVSIFSVRGRGYRLPAPVHLLDRASVITALGEQQSAFNIEIHDQLESTNTYLMEKAAQNIAGATCIAALLQTRGRGRRGRLWQSGVGNSLTFSLLWRFQSGAAALSGLSLAVGVALIRTLHGLGIASAQLKWPNDVLIGHQKLAGILIELQGDMDGPSAAVIGIGINLRMPQELRNCIDQPVIDLESATQQDVNPNELLALLLQSLSHVLHDFEHHGFANLRAEWTQYHAYQNKPVRLLLPNGSELHGVVNGVAPDGILLVNTDSGEQRFSAGEISLRGLI
ncbi:bifunctional biotin--[acetyl-CoA-carboxylase] ligase/biotin operon repressor BirA [Methyloradius palustris]|uniref:Bifunctional ligase/repressor BirA n=1 Tax=Methyloradius palustris TaxID=2778876 RepID=A0A8D5G4P9_9PROT|nr:bifunctional biotin--[acetyl-CoA-carboxylase] ligase/biotin operon repressor BirA [Methyloradius palustris]BCM25695.1 bifunctional ligase/repressor BirA [Methyloradius palustris]